MHIKTRRSGFLHSVFKSTALGISFVVGVTMCGGPISRAAAQIANPPANGTAYEQAKRKIDHLMTALDVVNRNVDHSLFDIDALSQRLGSDPATIFRFARDEIRYEPYYGVLRGALGTLISRAGNSLDRSLLLAALLQKAGFEVEIARGTLNQDAARALVARLWEPVHPVPSAAPSLEALAPELGKALGLEPPKLLAAAEQMRKRTETAKNDLMTYVNSESNTLLKELTEAGVVAGGFTSNDELIAEAREHYWVHYRAPGGKWVELDSASAANEPGQTKVTAEDHYLPDALPEDRYHHLRLMVTLRTAQVDGDRDGSMRDTVMLDKELRVADQQGTDIVLANQPIPMSNLADLAAKRDSALNDTKGYQVILRTGDFLTKGRYSDLDGNISDDPPTSSATGGGGPTSGVVGFGAGLRGIGGGGLLGTVNGKGNTPTAVSRRIVGEWADYRLSSPGPRNGQPTLQDNRRDMVAPEIVESWSPSEPTHPMIRPNRLQKDELRRRLLWSVDLTPITGALDGDNLGYMQLRAWMNGRDEINDRLKIAFAIPTDQTHPPGVVKFPLVDLALAASISELSAGMMNVSFPKLRSFFQTPALIGYERAMAVPAGDGKLDARYDIIRYSPQVAAASSVSQQEVNRTATISHALQGVLATRLEWALMGAQNATRGITAPIYNATEIFDLARRGQVATVVLQPGSEGNRMLTGLPLPAAAKAELSASLALGNTIIVPSKMVDFDGKSTIAWWRFNPPGELIGVMLGGRGQAMSEEAWLYHTTVFSFEETHCLYEAVNDPDKGVGDTVRCVLLAAGYYGSELYLPEEVNHLLLLLQICTS